MSTGIYDQKWPKFCQLSFSMAPYVNVNDELEKLIRVQSCFSEFRIDLRPETLIFNRLE